MHFSHVVEKRSRVSLLLTRSIATLEPAIIYLINLMDLWRNPIKRPTDQVWIYAILPGGMYVLDCSWALTLGFRGRPHKVQLVDQTAQHPPPPHAYMMQAWCISASTGHRWNNKSKKTSLKIRWQLDGSYAWTLRTSVCRLIDRSSLS
jgi:hypothetical protein